MFFAISDHQSESAMFSLAVYAYYFLPVWQLNERQSRLPTGE